MPDVLLTPAEAAALLRTSEAWLKARARAEAIPHIRVARRGIRFTTAQVEAIAKKLAVTPRERRTR